MVEVLDHGLYFVPLLMGQSSKLFKGEHIYPALLSCKNFQICLPNPLHLDARVTHNLIWLQLDLPQYGKVFF